MHARIDQLLRLRDGEWLDATARAHVESCLVCSAELARLQETRERLCRLPQAPARESGWTGVEDRMARRERTARRHAVVGRYAAAAAVAALAVVAGIRYLETRAGSASPPAAAAAGEVPAEEPARELLERSAELEAYLASLPERPAVERADMSLPIETLEAQVQWLDHQLSLAGMEGEPRPDVERLWRDRVEVMNSLLQLRYVEAQRVAL
jgi:hypothetical protein